MNRLKKNIQYLNYLSAMIFLGIIQAQTTVILSTSMPGKHELTYQGGLEKLDADGGFSVSLENYFIKEENLKIGLGIDHMFKRSLKNNQYLSGQINMGNIRFQNIIYGTMKILLNSNKNSIYAKVKIGHSTPKGDGNYEGDISSPVKYTGGMFYGFGGEIYLNQFTFVEFMSHNYKGEALVNSIDLEIKHTHLNIGIGYTF